MKRIEHTLVTAACRILVLGSFLLPTATIAADIVVADESHSIQKAIDAAAAGDVIVVHPGHYRERLRIPEEVTVRSAGDSSEGEIGLRRAEAVIIDAGGEAPAAILEDGAVLDGLTITAAGVFDSEEFDHHYAERGENLPDERGATGVDGGSGAIMVAGTSATVIRCIVHNNGHPGIALSGSGNRSEVVDNHVYQNMGGGIGIANGARPRIAGNRCWRNLRAGIGCRNSSPVIENNTCYENVRGGIGIREAATPLVRANHCYRNQRAGIGVRMPGTEPQIHANRCFENGMAGIGCRAGAAPIIVGNECFNNRLAGIGAMTDAQPLIVGNHIYGNGAAAIGLESCGNGKALIRDNDISAKSLVALGINKGWHLVAEGNRISREGGMPPLVMVAAGARAEFHGNTFTGSGVAAIRSEGRIFVSANIFDCPKPRKGGPPQNAVWALPGSALAQTNDNRITGWRETKNSAVLVSSRAELLNALAEAVPGQTILISAGDYDGGISVRDLAGTLEQPIVIAGADRDHPPVIRGGNAGMQLKSPRHIELRNLIIAGAGTNGLNIDDGGSDRAPAQDVTLSNLKVIDVGDDGNQDGIKLSGVSDFRIANCNIERWGKSGSGIDMVGCHDGLIVNSDFRGHDGAESGSGVQAKGGSQAIIVSRCRFENAGSRGVNLGGSTGAAYFRPEGADYEARDITVEDCEFQGSMAAVAFVGVDRGTVRHNSILRPTAWALRILQENTEPGILTCRDGRFEFNVVKFRSDEIRTIANVGANTAAESFGFTRNTWICIDKPAATGKLIRLPVEEKDARFGSDSPADHRAGVRPVTTATVQPAK